MSAVIVSLAVKTGMNAKRIVQRLQTGAGADGTTARRESDADGNRNADRAVARVDRIVAIAQLMPAPRSSTFFPP